MWAGVRWSFSKSLFQIFWKSSDVRVAWGARGPDPLSLFCRVMPSRRRRLSPRLSPRRCHVTSPAAGGSGRLPTASFSDNPPPPPLSPALSLSLSGIQPIGSPKLVFLHPASCYFHQLPTKYPSRRSHLNGVHLSYLEPLAWRRPLSQNIRPYRGCILKIRISEVVIWGGKKRNNSIKSLLPANVDLLVFPSVCLWVFFFVTMQTGGCVRCNTISMVHARRPKCIFCLGSLKMRR